MFDWENTFSSNKVDKQISFMNAVLNIFTNFTPNK